MGRWKHEDGMTGVVVSVVEAIMWGLGAAVLVSMLSCGPVSAPRQDKLAYVTQRGVKVFLHGWYQSTEGQTWDDMDAYVSLVDPGMSVPWSVSQCQEGLLVGVHSHDELNAMYRATGGATPDVLGWFDVDGRVAHIGGGSLTEQDNPWGSSYVHEQVHMLHACWGWPVDYSHTLHPEHWRLVSERPRRPL